jgi:hypothetical protein
MLSGDLELQPALIDRAYERLVEAIADDTLAPGQRIRQEELGRALRTVPLVSSALADQLGYRNTNVYWEGLPAPGR